MERDRIAGKFCLFTNSLLKLWEGFSFSLFFVRLEAASYQQQLEATLVVLGLLGRMEETSFCLSVCLSV